MQQQWIPWWLQQWVPRETPPVGEEREDMEQELEAEGGPLGARGWTAWKKIPTGATLDTPAPVRFGGNLHLFVRGTDNGIYWNRMSRQTGWGEWRELPGGGRTTAAPCAVEFGNRMHVFVRGTDDRLYQNTHTGGNNWTGWSQVPGNAVTPSGPAITVHNGVLYLFIR
ncbi:MAG TPA: hypothetical protein VD902_22515, partial [Symbiobacteriaceae bacterium]|nr:hypothetical protein [Symbiobacteriaceae bacterium]